MAITANDIRNKDFTLMESKWYDPDQVDDFLDEIANQLAVTAAEDQTLRARVAELEAELAKAKAETAAAVAAKPDYDEEAYFKDLQNAMHEALAGARRVADEAIAEAKRSAEETRAAADAYAAKTTGEADALAKSTTEAAENKVAALNAEAETLTARNKEYRENFRKLVQDQLNSLA